jgi:hypothetical protein
MFHKTVYPGLAKYYLPYPRQNLLITSWRGSMFKRRSKLPGSMYVNSVKYLVVRHMLHMAVTMQFHLCKASSRAIYWYYNHKFPGDINLFLESYTRNHWKIYT